MVKISSARLNMEGGRIDNAQLKNYGETFLAGTSNNLLNFPAQVSDKQWSKIAVGQTHTAALTTSGQIWAWGLGTSGQLGQVTAALSASSPVQVASDKTWTSVAAGRDQVIAITTGGAMWAWGGNTFGQLAQISNVTNRSSPVQIASDKTWANVTTSDISGFAITTTGALWGWGANNTGQLAQITNATNNSSPVQIASDKTWSSVAASANVTLGITTTGQLWAWGTGAYGSLGQNNTTNVSSPVQVASDKTWVSAAHGGRHAAGVTTAGTLWTWGSNAGGQLGSNTGNVTRSSPVQIASDKTWASAAAGDSHTAALTNTGVAWAFGLNTSGQLGDGTIVNKSSPVQVATGRVWGSVSASLINTAALTPDKSLYYWGSNASAQSGNPLVAITAGTIFPLDLSTSNVWKIVLGSALTSLEFRNAPATSHYSFTLILQQDVTGSRTVAWPGYVLWGAGTPALSTIPGRIDVFTLSTFDGGATWLGFMAQKGITGLDASTATIWGWGNNAGGQVGANDVVSRLAPAPVFTSTVSSVAAGGLHTVAVTSNSQLWTWGTGTSGQLGSNTATSRSSPVLVGGDKTWASAAGGGSHTVAVTTAGALWAWGLGTSGQLAQITSALTNSSPVQVASDKTWSTVAAGGQHSAAITTVGGLWAWGLGTSGQLGQVTTAVSASSPVQVASDKTWSIVASGGIHVAAITTAGALWVWGSSGSGQLGQISNATSRSSAVQVASDKTWASVAASVSHTAAITTAGALWIWGGNANGQLGDNTAANKSSPVQIASDKTWASVAGGASHTVAATTSGQLWAWGANASFQVGNNTAINASSPVQVGGNATWVKVAAGYSHSIASAT